MQIKIAELDGIALDWAVYQCEHLAQLSPEEFKAQRNSKKIRGEYVFRWSSSWSQCGEIIERERLMIQPQIGFAGAGNAWEAFAIGPYAGVGHHPRLAAMRCYVASRSAGDTVEIPDGLCQ
jgi:hypothetical protein